MLSGIGPAGHLPEVGVDLEGGPRRGRRRTCRTTPWCRCSGTPTASPTWPSSTTCATSLAGRPGGPVRSRPTSARPAPSSPAATGCRRRTCRSTWRRRASTTTGCTSRPARWSPRRRRWSRSPAAATCGCGRRTRPGTRRSRRRTSTTRPTSTRCSPGCAAPGRSARRAPLAAYLDRPWQLPDRPSDEDFVEHARTWAQTLYHPTSTCAMGTRRGRRGRPRAAGPRRRRAARRRRVGHAGRRPRQHQRPHHHDRREGRRPRSRSSAMTATEARHPTTFESLDPRTGDVVGTHPVHTAEEVRAAVARAREEAAWWARPVLRRARGHLQTLEGRHDAADRPARRADAPGDRQAARRRDARGRAGDRPPVLGGVARGEGAQAAQGADRAGDGQPGGVRRVPAARCDRRDRPVELPGVHADGLDRLRAGGRQRGGLQAAEYTPGVGRVAGPDLPRDRSAARCSRSSPASARPAHALCTRGRRQGRVHRLDRAPARR